MSILDVLQYFVLSAIFVCFIVFISAVCGIFLVIDTEEEVDE